MSDYQPRRQDGWPAQPPYGTYGPPAASPPPTAPRRRRRRRRWPIVLTVIVILILAIAAVGDQIARSYAQGRIAEKIQTSGDLSAKPAVSIQGWPFLTQVASHEVGTVDISAHDVTANSGKLPFSFTATATGVHLNSSFSGATVNQINGQATLPFSSVAGLLGLPAGTVTLQADPAKGPNAVKADAAIGSVTGTVSLANQNQIDVRLGSATGLASVLHGLSGNTIKIQIPTLPAGLVVRSVSVNSQGIVAIASAANTTLSQ